MGVIGYQIGRKRDKIRNKKNKKRWTDKEIWLANCIGYEGAGLADSLEGDVGEESGCREYGGDATADVGDEGEDLVVLCIDLCCGSGDVLRRRTQTDLAGSNDQQKLLLKQ